MEPIAQPPVRSALRAALAGAMKQRDRPALSAYRTALAAIDNAEAVPLTTEHRAGALEFSPIGVGRNDVERRTLTNGEMIAIVRREAQERLEAAASLPEANKNTALRLRREAQLLCALLDDNSDEPPDPLR